MDSQGIRKATHERLRSAGFARQPPLPLPEHGRWVRPKEDVATRANGLHLLYAVYLEGPESAQRAWNYVRGHGWEDHLTAREREKLRTGSLSVQDLIDFSWRKESCKALLWLGSVISDSFYSEISECDFSEYYALIPPEKSFSAYLADFTLRDSAGVTQVLDFYYCLHWYCLHAPDVVAGARIPITRSVVVERRRALEWAMSDDDWDQVPLDT